MSNKKLITIMFGIFIIFLLTISILTYHHDDILILEKETDQLESSSDKEVWSYLEWQEKFPKEKDLITAFHQRIQNKAVPYKEKNKIKIAIVYPTNQASDYWRRNVMAFKKRLQEIGLSFEIKEYESAPGETQLQQKQLSEALNSNIDYLITTIDESVDLGIIGKALKKHEVKIIIQNLTTPLKRFGKQQPLLYTGFDHELGSVQLADHFAQKFPQGANWILLLFTDGIVSQQRGETFVREISKHKNMNLLSIYKTEGKREISKQATLNAIKQFQKIDFIYSCATDVSLGAIDALNEKNMKQNIYINGWGGGSSELSLLEKNMLDLTVMRMNDDAAVSMAEAINLDIQGRKSEIPVVYSGSFEIVEAKNTTQINLLKAKAFRYSNEGKLND